MFDNVYKGRRVLVTGHTGFKGSWITLWLLELGAKVCGFSDDVPTDPANFVIQGLEKRIVHVKGDIRNLNDVQKTFNRFRPEIVFHLAAQSLVRKSYDAPLQTFITNTTGTLNVLEAIRLSTDVKAGVIITSDKCYHNSEWTWGYRENDTLGGDDPYSASKGCAELVIKSYNASYFSGSNKRVASTRAGNVIGGGDWAEDRIIPDLVRAWSDNKPVVIRNPDATRPWQHVFEPLSGYLWLGAKLMADSPDSLGKYQEAFNFGPLSDSVYTVRSVLDTMAQYLEGASWKVENTDNFKKESSLLKLCCDKALHKLKWHSVLSFDETIEMTAKWYEAYYKQSLDQAVSQDGNQTFNKTREISLEQLQEYVAKAQAKGLEWSK
jgi:CDP-glucose 4,6-dehydratase